MTNTLDPSPEPAASETSRRRTKADLGSRATIVFDQVQGAPTGLLPKATKASIPTHLLQLTKT